MNDWQENVAFGVFVAFALCALVLVADLQYLLFVKGCWK